MLISINNLKKYNFILMHSTNLVWFQSVALILVQIAFQPVKRGGKEEE